ncbi:hypothetical protein [Micromonospora sp. CA-248212]|uniref:hypothetical protein n=1 Tax=Micromonospora sp. CA-248212 TaxID=3239961 RepID=UPI003D8F72E9
MTWWRWLRAFLSNQATLAALVVDLEARSDRLVALLRREKACRELEAEMRRAELATERASHRREAESLDAGNQTLIELNRHLEATNSRQAQRLGAAHRFADRLPDDLAAELRALLAPTFSAQPEEATRVR